MAERAIPISVIIPLREGDKVSPRLLEALDKYGVEIIVSREGTRAKSLNIGAAKAQRKYLWFLHADSVMGRYTFSALKAALKAHPDRLHYFDLLFMDDGPKQMWINAMGANLRSRVFGMPFGDQGFCIRKDLFFKVGGYPEQTEYGEDHLFVWQVRRHGIRLNCTHAKIGTSARAYAAEGWLLLTLKRQKMWISQALPEFQKLVQRK